MKKAFTFFLLVCSIFLLSGCGVKTAGNKGVNEFENMLKENKITYDKMENENPQKGLKKEYYYYFDDESMVKLLVFDTSSDLYKQAKEENMINEAGIDAKTAVTVNENFGISFASESAYKVLIKDKFENLNLK